MTWTARGEVVPENFGGYFQDSCNLPYDQRVQNYERPGRAANPHQAFSMSWCYSVGWPVRGPGLND